MTLPERYSEDILFFFAGRPDALELYEALFALMDARLPDCSVKVQKSQISYYSPRLFAMVSLPRRKSERGIVLTLGLSRRLDSPRVSVSTEPYHGRWTHHFPIMDKSGLDAELLELIAEALTFSREKRRCKK